MYGIPLIPVQRAIVDAMTKESSFGWELSWLICRSVTRGHTVPVHRLGSSNFLLWLMLLSLSTSIQTIWFLFNTWMAYSGKHPMAVIAMSDPPGLTQRSVFNFLAIFLTPSAKCAWNSSHTYTEHLWNCAPGQGSHIFCSQSLTRSLWIQSSGYVYAITWAIFLPSPNFFFLSIYSKNYEQLWFYPAGYIGYRFFIVPFEDSSFEIQS